MGSGEFKAQAGVHVILENFEFDATCQVVSFELYYLANGQAISTRNRGARFDSDCRQLIRRAKPGDFYFVDNIKVKCPGDMGARRVNSMGFLIK